jgi:hypothetical protein
LINGINYGRLFKGISANVPTLGEEAETKI